MFIFYERLTFYGLVGNYFMMLYSFIMVCVLIIPIYFIIIDLEKERLNKKEN